MRGKSEECDFGDGGDWGRVMILSSAMVPVLMGVPKYD